MSARPAAASSRTRVLIALLAGGVAGALIVTASDPVSAPAPPPAAEPTAAELTDYERELARIDRELDLARRFADAEPRSSRRRAEAAALALARARLSGDLSDHAACERELALAFDAAMPGSGPFLLRASFEASVHRWDRAAADLAVLRGLPRPRDERAEALALEGDVATARSQPAEARAAYEAALALHRDPWTLSRLAHLLSHGGDPEGAAAAYAEAERLAGPRDALLRATLALEEGRMELLRGQHAEARERLESAERSFSGWWRIDEALAELALADGRRDEAIARLEIVVERTGSPRAMDRLAEALLEAGRPDEAAPWVTRARTLWDEQSEYEALRSPSERSRVVLSPLTERP